MEDKEQIQDRIRRHEGKRLKPYQDSQGNLTIGIGRNLSITGISDDEAEYMFMNDLSDAVTKFNMLPEKVIKQCNLVRQEILIEMIFQLGFDGILRFKKMLSAIEAGDFIRAAGEIYNSLLMKQCRERAEEYYYRMKNGE